MKKLVLLLAAFASFGTAQTVFPGNDSHIYWWGAWTFTSTAATGDANKRVDFSATCGTIEVQLFGSQTYQISVDGGAAAPVTPTGATWIYQTVFGPGADTTHTITISGSFVRYDATVRCTGAAPAMVTPTGYGTYFALVGSTNIASDGPSQTTAGNNPNNHWISADGALRFLGSMTDLYAWTGDTYNSTTLWMDGAQVASFGNTATNSFAWQLKHWYSALDPGIHNWELKQSGNMTDSTHGAMGGEAYIYQIMLSGGSGLVAQNQVRKLSVGFYGDSIECETGVGLINGLYGHGTLGPSSIGMAGERSCNSGQSVSTFLRDNTSQITSGTSHKVIVLEGGSGDNQALKAIGDCATAATFTGDEKTMIHNAAAAMPAGSVILIRSVLPHLFTNFASRSLYTAAQLVAVNCYMASDSLAQSIPAYWIGTDNWIIPTSGVDTVDGGHPNASGNAKVAMNDAPGFSAAVNLRSFGWMSQ